MTGSPALPHLPLPRAAEPFVTFPALLRAHGFAVSPDQTIGFIEAIGLLGPRDIDDIRRAGVAMLAIPKDREAEFDALFRAHFLDQTIAADLPGEDETVEAYEPTGAEEQIDQPTDEDEAGEEAATAERLSTRDFAPADDNEALARFRRLAGARLPRRRSYRYRPTHLGRVPDLRRTLRDAARRDGEVFTLPMRMRKTRQRRIALLIDVSGSMKERTESSLRFAHALVRSAERAEVFTLGTRLTRVTPALRARDADQALARVSTLVADFDGGTRIGEALQAYLAVPRFAGFARGAAVVILSDGLERGGPEAMTDAVLRLSRMAWRLTWLTPLAAEPGYQPETAALAAVLPHLDGLGDASSLDAVCDHILELAHGSFAA